MKTPFRGASDGIDLTHWEEAPSREEALHFLRGLARTSDGMRKLRHVLWDLGYTDTIARLDDDEVLELLATQLANGTFRIWETPAVIPSLSLPQIEEERSLTTQEPTASLSVRVRSRRSGVGDATVEVSGPTSRKGVTQSQIGAVEFANLPIGRYTVSIKLNDDQAKLYGPPTEKTVELHENLKSHVDFRLNQLNVVRPLIEAEYKVVLLEKNLSQYQTNEEEKIFADPTRIELSLEQTNKAYPPKGGVSLKCTPAKVDIFLDGSCTQQLGGDPTAGAPLTQPMIDRLIRGQRLIFYLRGKTAGKFKVSLDIEAAANPFVIIDPTPHEIDLGVVELRLLLHQHDTAALATLTVNPNQAPVQTAGDDQEDYWDHYHENLMKNYHDSLRDLEIPEQILLSDREKVESGRVVHANLFGGRHGRAKLIVEKLDKSQWPEGTDDYKVQIETIPRYPGLFHCESEFGGRSKIFPLLLEVADLKEGPQEFWLEGKQASKSPRDITISAGINRPSGGLQKEAKRNGDWARFTVVKIRDVIVDYTPEEGKAVAWDESQEEFYINLKPEPEGRKITIGAQLSEPIAGITVHFMLAPHMNNLKRANWGVDLPVRDVKKRGDLMIGGPDSDKFRIQHNEFGASLILEDGVLDSQRHNEYECTVFQFYSDGSVIEKKFELDITKENANGFDTTGGIEVESYGMGYLSGDFPTYRQPFWRWDAIDEGVKHWDKERNREEFLHASAKTDDTGYAKKELMLSRFGGDKFIPSCYIDQDPHLAKFVDGHEELSKFFPVSSQFTIKVARKIWIQKIAVTELDNSPDLSAVRIPYRHVHVRVEVADKINIPLSEVQNLNPPVIYPKYMIRRHGNNDDSLVLSNDNLDSFFNRFSEQDDKPILLPILFCNGLFKPENSEIITRKDLRPSDFPVTINVGKYVLDPPLQGGTFVKEGYMLINDFNMKNEKITKKLYKIKDYARINPARRSRKEIEIFLPENIQITDRNTIDLRTIIVQAAKEVYGSQFPGQNRILVVYDPSENFWYPNAVVHEIGHALHQVAEGNPAGGIRGIPEHPKQYLKNGSHCRYQDGQCVMYESLGEYVERFCPICHPYLLVQDMTKIS